MDGSDTGAWQSSFYFAILIDLLFFHIIHNQT